MFSEHRVAVPILTLHTEVLTVVNDRSNTTIVLAWNIDLAAHNQSCDSLRLSKTCYPRLVLCQGKSFILNDLLYRVNKAIVFGSFPLNSRVSDSVERWISCSTFVEDGISSHWTGQ